MEYYYWRAWEYVVHDESQNIGILPFKPLHLYTGQMYGDFLRGIFVKPKPKELRQQTFVIDEYGFRNQPGMYKAGVDAVDFGTSQVAGLADTQSGILGEILTRKYHIRTYTYPKASIQQFYQEDRFIKKPPKFAIIIGTDLELLQRIDLFSLHESNNVVYFHPWTRSDWDKIFGDKLFHLDYLRTLDYAKRFSTLRVLSYYIFTEIMNKKYNRTQLLLKKRGITLIVGVMPSKSYLYRPLYKNIPISKTAIYALYKELDKSNIQHVNLLNPILSFMKNNKTLLYHSDDSHWNSHANEIIAEQLAKKIHEISGE